MRRFIKAIPVILLCVTLGLPQANSINYDPQIDSLIQQVDTANISRYIADLAWANGHQSRVNLTPGNEWAAGYLKQTLDGFSGLTSVEFDTFYVLNAPAPYNSRPMVNVVATLAGHGQTDMYYIIGGHFDTSASLDPTITWSTDWPTAVAPGADDNGSGVATTLEIARILSDPDNQFNNDITIKFILFGAEESSPAYFNDHHKGSHHYASTAYSNGDNIQGAYILDMYGFNDTGNYYFNIVSNPNSLILGEDMLEINQLYQIGLQSNSSPFTYADYSDHDQFWAYWYKAILLIENAPPWDDNLPWYSANPYYHTHQDTPDKVNMELVAKITRITLGTIASLTKGVTDIHAIQPGETVPETISLFPNYPNPFNATTTISYRLRSSGKVTLTLYNSAGQEVSEPVNQWQSAGDYKIHWTANDNSGNGLPSGLYFVRLRMNGTENTRKMILLR